MHSIQPNLEIALIMAELDLKLVGGNCRTSIYC
jgi:hypothetical protein